MTNQNMSEMPNQMPYDSKADTLEHIHVVRDNISHFNKVMLDRAAAHDKSKLSPQEKDGFDTWTPRLKEMVFGSEEYKASLAALKPSLDHHYANNSHHPEHYPNGIAGMDLFDLVEMYCDWKAAAIRGKGDGTINLKMCVDRFGISEQLASILQNTIDRWDMK